MRRDHLSLFEPTFAPRLAPHVLPGSSLRSAPGRTRGHVRGVPTPPRALQPLPLRVSSCKVRGFPTLGRSARSPRFGQARGATESARQRTGLAALLRAPRVSPPRAHALRLPSGPACSSDDCPTHPAPLRRTAAPRDPLCGTRSASDRLRGALPPVIRRFGLPLRFVQPYNEEPPFGRSLVVRQLSARSRPSLSGREIQPAPPPHSAQRSALVHPCAAVGQRSAACPSAAWASLLLSAAAVWGVARPARPPALVCSGAGALTSGNGQPVRPHRGRARRPLPDERPRNPRSPCRVWVAGRFALPWRGCGAVAPRFPAPWHGPPALGYPPSLTLRGVPLRAGPCGAERARSGSRAKSLCSLVASPSPRAGAPPRAASAGSGGPRPRCFGRSVTLSVQAAGRVRPPRAPSRSPPFLFRVRSPCPPPRPLPL